MEPDDESLVGLEPRVGTGGARLRAPVCRRPRPRPGHLSPTGRRRHRRGRRPAARALGPHQLARPWYVVGHDRDRGDPGVPAVPGRGPGASRRAGRRGRGPAGTRRRGMPALLFAGPLTSGWRWCGSAPAGRGAASPCGGRAVAREDPGGGGRLGRGPRRRRRLESSPRDGRLRPGRRRGLARRTCATAWSEVLDAVVAVRPGAEAAVAAAAE